MSTPPKYTYPVTVGSEQKARILKYLAGSETGGNEKKAYSTQHAGTANSGYSLGQTQIDLAHRTRERSELVDFLRRQGTFSQDELAKLEQGLGSKGNNAAITGALKNKLDGAIGGEAGKALVKSWDDRQAAYVGLKTNEVVEAARSNPRYKSDPEFRKFADSPAFSAMVADNVNQFGDPKGLKRYVAGEKVELKSGKTAQLGDRSLNMGTLAEYESNYQWVREGDGARAPDKGAEDIKRRRLDVVDSLQEDRLISPEDAQGYANSINIGYKSDNQRKDGQTAGQSGAVQPATGKTPVAPTAGGGTTIQPGDTLSKIAARHGVSAEELAKANNITDPNRIQAGQALTIPAQSKDKAVPAAPPSISADDAHQRQMPLGDFLKNKMDDLRANGSHLGKGVQIASAGDAASLAAEAAQGQEQNTPADPKVAAMVEMAGAPVDNPGKAALLKPVEKLTQSEMTDMINSAQEDYRGWRSGDPLKAHTYEKVQDWHATMYGDGPQANDGGKPVAPPPIRTIPDQPSPHLTPEGEDLWQATGRLGGKLAEAAATDGADNAVKSLQRGLNMLGDANPLPARSAAYAPYTKLSPVAEDGAYGPQTDFALKHAAARLGPGKVEEAFALGRFNTFAREAQRSGNPEGLEAKTHTVFAPLFRDPADTKAPKLEGGALQETLNDLGPRGQDDWTPLKVDNWIGPKTTEAFGKVLKTEDADGVTAAFGRGLGFL